MLDLEIIKSSGYFEEYVLKKWDILFDEWEVDTYLYIVYDGELSVQKSIKTKKWDYKILSLLGIWNIVGEGALSNSNPKEARIMANRDTNLLRIDGKTQFPKFVSHFPKEWYSLLITIIEIANTRLLRANKELTANYEVNIAISKIKDISLSSIYKLLLVFESILWVDQIIYFEKNLVMDNYFKIKYNSKHKGGIQNTIIKFPGGIFDEKKLQEEEVQLSKYTRHIELNLGEENYGFLLIGKDGKDFHENEEKLLQNTAGSFVWIIHQKKILDEQKNLNYMKSSL